MDLVWRRELRGILSFVSRCIRLPRRHLTVKKRSPVDTPGIPKTVAAGGLCNGIDLCECFLTVRVALVTQI